VTPAASSEGYSPNARLLSTRLFALLAKDLRLLKNRVRNVYNVSTVSAKVFV
jgi:hypothetical protein